jgi:hypothetical protein
MNVIKAALVIALAIVAPSLPTYAAKTDISDVFAFRSYDRVSPPRVTLIMCVDPLQEPGHGPNWAPFDPDVLYEIKVDNTYDAAEDVVFRFRFTTEQRLSELFQAYLGAGNGFSAPANSPPPVAPGTPIVPPRITSFDSPGLGLRQSYTVTVVKNGVETSVTGDGPFYAVPSNVGPRTMDYEALFAEATYATNVPGIRIFAGTVDEPFWADIGAIFDTFNFRRTVPSGVLSPQQDSAGRNFASDTVSGYSVNAIAIEVPVSLLTRTAKIEPATSVNATIGVWGTTSRPDVTVARESAPVAYTGAWTQSQRMGNPLISDLFIGNESKDVFSKAPPQNDAQFAAFFLDPTFARVLNAISQGALTIPGTRRRDLLPLIIYMPPVAASGTPPGPVADILRLNTGVPPTRLGRSSRLGLLGGDPAGYPNGRRPFDDVTDLCCV